MSFISPVKNLEELINKPAEQRSDWINYFFYYISKIYNILSSSKYYLYKYKILRKKKFEEFTISVGNIIIGGTGKTPFVIKLGNKLSSDIIKPLIINKDYGGIHSKIPKIVSDGEDIFHYPPLLSDEAFLTAISLLSEDGRNYFRKKGYYLPPLIKKLSIPVIACKNRFTVYKKYRELLNFNLIILDDAFQHFEVKRDIDIVLLDVLNPFGYEKIFPYGLLREPLYRLKRADFIILTGTERVGKDEVELIKTEIFEKTGLKEIYSSRNTGYTLNNYKTGKKLELNYLKNKKVLSFCGIASPDRFIKILNKIEGLNHKNIVFRDHQRYERRIIKKIEKSIKKYNPDFIITTSKDGVKLLKNISFGEKLWILEQEIEIDTKFIEKLRKIVERRKII